MNNLSTLPEFSPNKSARLKSLYSDFSRQKHSNPTAYDANVSWWRRTLSSSISGSWSPSQPHKLIIHTGKSLEEDYRWERVGKPMALSSVISELIQSGRMIPLKPFLENQKSIYFTDGLVWKVANMLVARPLWWAMEQMNVVGEATSDNTWKTTSGDYVLVDLLEKASDAVIAHYRKGSGLSLADSLFDIESFQAEFGSIALPGVELSRKDVEVLIKYLQRDKGLLVIEKEVIKFVDESDEKESVVTAVDHGVLDMKNAVSRLEAQIEEIQRKIDQRADQVKENLRLKRKDIALSYLRSKKQLEELLPKRLRSLETIQTTLDQVESARHDIEIMKAYETSTSTLRTILSDPALQRDRVDATLDAMAEANAEYKEIEETIEAGMPDTGGVVDEDELAKELEALVQEREREEKEEKERKEREEREQKEKRERELIEREQRENELRARELERERQRLAARESKAALEAHTAEVASEELWRKRWEEANQEKEAQKIKDRQKELEKRAQWELME